MGGDLGGGHGGHRVRSTGCKHSKPVTVGYG